MGKIVTDNDLKVGDECLFEIMECCSIIVKMKVQILRGYFPSELLGKGGMDGES